MRLLRRLDVDVQIGPPEVQAIDAPPRGVRAHPRHRRPHRLLHHVAERAGQDEPAGAGHPAGLDEHDVAAVPGPAQPDRDPRRARALLNVRFDERGRAETLRGRFRA